jgi:multiple sugar transport system substrate-binding protein
VAASSAASSAAASSAASSAAASGSPGAADTGISGDLVWWTKATGTEKQIAVCTAKYPNIKVKTEQIGGGDYYSKLQTAIQAGSGGPDIAQIEYPYLPTYMITNALLDLVPYGANDVKDAFVPWTWGQVSKGNSVYAIPWDSGPMGLLYREDILKKYNIAVPTTWAEFADAARKLHAANPKIYLANFDPGDSTNPLGLTWQAGARPFDAISETEVKVAVNDAQSLAVWNYWSPLIAEGVISTDPQWVDTWFQGLANGKYASWIGAAWSPGFLSGTAKDTAGKWRVAPLPQWNAGENLSGNWGGSSYAVLAATKQPEAAAAIAKCLGADQEAAATSVKEVYVYPSNLAVLNDPTFADATDPFFGDQKVNQIFADISKGIDPNFKWPPFQDYVNSSFATTVGKAITNKSSLADGVKAWQDDIASYAQGQGFTVSTG